MTKRHWISLFLTGFLLLALGMAALPAAAKADPWTAGKPVKTVKPGSQGNQPQWKVTPAPQLEEPGSDISGQDVRGPKNHKNGKGHVTEGTEQCADTGTPCEVPTDDTQPCADPETPCEPPTDNPVDTGNQAGHAKMKARNMNVTVTEINGDQVTLTLKDGSTVTVTLDENTTIRVPAGKGTTTLEPGERLVMRTVKNEDGTMTVVQAKVIPGKPERLHRVGVVVAYEPGVSITVQGKDGATTTFALSPDAKLLGADGAEVQVGSTVTIISPRMFTGDPIARGIVVHPGCVVTTQPDGTSTGCEATDPSLSKPEATTPEETETATPEATDSTTPEQPTEEVTVVPPAGS